MKIACVGTGWYPNQPGGLEKYVYGMINSLSRAGDCADVFLTGAVPPPMASTHFYSIGDAAGPLWKRAIAARSAFAQSYREPYDVLNIHFAMNALPLIPFTPHHTARVVHFHGPWAAEGAAEGGNALGVRIKAALERFVYRRSDRFIVLSTAFKQILIGYGIDAECISVIPMGIDCDFFRPAPDRAGARAALGWPADAFVFFTARRLINRVGLQELLQTVKLMTERSEPFVLKIAGKGPLHQELETAILQLGISDRVELLGFVSEDDLVRCYQASDATVVPSQALEGFGTIISESLACGTPAIVTPVGGMPEAVAPLDPALITASASPAGIAERMSAALDKRLVLPDAAACRAYAVANYDWAKVWQRIRTVFTG